MKFRIWFGLFAMAVISACGNTQVLDSWHDSAVTPAPAQRVVAIRVSLEVILLTTPSISQIKRIVCYRHELVGFVYR